MSATSTAPTVIDAFITAVNTELTGVTCWPDWPGPARATAEMVVLGTVTWDDYVIPVVKAGRKQREERYGVEFSVFVVGGTGATPADPTPARDRAFEILEALEDVLAEDPSGGTDYQTVQWVQLRPATAETREFENGWAYRIDGTIDVRARLQ